MAAVVVRQQHGHSVPGGAAAAAGGARAVADGEAAVAGGVGAGVEVAGSGRQRVGRQTSGSISTAEATTGTA